MDADNILTLDTLNSFDPRASQFTQDDTAHPFQFTQNTQNSSEHSSKSPSPAPDGKTQSFDDDEASLSSSVIIERALKTRDTPVSKNNETSTQTVTPAASIPRDIKRQKTSDDSEDLWRSYGLPADGSSFTVRTPTKSSGMDPDEASKDSGSSGSGSDNDCRIIDDPTEIAALKMVAMSSNICTGCGCRSAYCHERLYRCYCLKAVYAYFHNGMTNCHWAKHFSGSSPSTVSSIYRYAYNDRRRGDLDYRFGFFNSNWVSLPECMEKGSFQEAMNMMNDKKLQNELKASNENGYKNYCEAKAANRA